VWRVLHHVVEGFYFNERALDIVATFVVVVAVVVVAAAAYVVLRGNVAVSDATVIQATGIRCYYCGRHLRFDF